jgi:hypothetical protein
VLIPRSSQPFIWCCCFYNLLTLFVNYCTPAIVWCCSCFWMFTAFLTKNRIAFSMYRGHGTPGRYPDRHVRDEQRTQRLRRGTRRQWYDKSYLCSYNVSTNHSADLLHLTCVLLIIQLVNESNVLLIILIDSCSYILPCIFTSFIAHVSN